MNALKRASVLLLLAILPGLLLAATPYGEAVIRQGSMTIVREGRSLQFKERFRPIQVNEEDLIRVRDHSQVVLTSREKARMTLGSNAVFHVKPWRARGKSGFVRALFGRFRATIAGLVGGEQFNVKTATATIGVKGTEYLGHLNVHGATVGGALEHSIFLTSPGGAPKWPETPVQQGFLGMVFGFVPPRTLPLDDELLRLLSDLNSPPPNDPRARRFPLGQALLTRGLLNQDELSEGQGERLPPSLPPLILPSLPSTGYDPNEGASATNRARIPLQFQ